MLRYRELICLTLIAVVTLFGRFGQSFHQKQVTRAPQPPQRFFPTHAYVVDHIYGSLQPVVKLLRDEELIFVMYYAPWDAECMRVRGEFIQAAKILSDVVKFVAVNCWWHEGECRRRMKFISFPELFMYHTGIQDGYRFYGPMEAEYFVRFVEKFIRPIQPLHNIEGIKDFLAQQDNTVIGYFDYNASPQPPGVTFHQFYLAALRMITYDTSQTVRFGVVHTRQTAKYFDMSEPGRFVLARTGNYTLKYPDNYNMTCRNITAWILRKKQANYGKWLVPPFSKSITLSLHMQRGPVVLLFAPMNPLFERNPYVDVIREAALSYFNCQSQSNLPLAHVISRSIKNSAIFHSSNFDVQQKCQQKPTANKIIDFTEMKRYRTSKCCSCSLPISSALDRTSVCEYCVLSEKSSPRPVCDIQRGSEVMTHINSWGPAQINTCSNSYQSYNVNEHTSLCCKQFHTRVPPNLFLDSGNSGEKGRKITDPYVANGAQLELKRQCRKFALQKLKRLIPIENMGKLIDYKSDFNVGNFSGLQCQTNRTVNFHVLDNSYYSVFAERIGVYTPSSLPKEPAVILVDLKDDAHYVLRESFSRISLSNFVLNYTYGSLPRLRRSSVEPVPTSSPGPVVQVTEVTADTFQGIVMDNRKDVVLLYYTPWCGFCSRFAQVYLALSQYFKSRDDIIFARINADTNDLPWEFTVDTYPTILFFPAYRYELFMNFSQSKSIVPFYLREMNSLRTLQELQKEAKGCNSVNVYAIVPV